MEETTYLKGRKDLIDVLRKIPFLQSYEDKYLMTILTLSKLRKYKTGEVIVREAEKDNWFYLIISGEVKIEKYNNEIARLDFNGGTFGELSVIDGMARSASVIAAKDTQCLAIDRSFIDILQSEDKTKFEAVYYRLMAEVLAHRLRKTSEKLSLVMENFEQLKKTTPV